MDTILKIGAVVGMIFLASCAGKAAPVSETPASQTADGLADLKGKEWRLITVRTPDGNTPFSREKLEAASMGDFFTLRFDAERVSGKAAPNRYSGPYKAEGDALSFGLLAGTRMAALIEPEDLTEQAYYNYLAQTSRWALAGERLELYTKDPDGAETTLIFAGFAVTPGESPPDSGNEGTLDPGA